MELLLSYLAINTLTCWGLLLQAIADACKVPETFVSELTEDEVPDECEEHFDENQELEQLLSGKICFKFYPFSTGRVLPLCWIYLQVTLCLLFIFFMKKMFCRDAYF